MPARQSRLRGRSWPAGIDTSNIVEEGRRGRRPAAPTINYAAVDADSSSSSGSGGEEDQGGPESDLGSPGTQEGSEPAGTARGPKQVCSRPEVALPLQLPAAGPG